ncbi:hypothetical protein PHLGIDRAFT_483430 [Phlebiopsis gigantea 11061_1 CR5-6]|uniref:Uncharacterized protein n=1 Tax=Phlebiopsis gigantea (strain 11061_1 CR5-6) TaxID=745531 RepID=A0A0C3S5X3_PHLG1|nr:hypothetical protein PHLGIDRAFT_483430 [Phlebiopsis gigantea 11061_1 CR5-6]
MSDTDGDLLDTSVARAKLALQVSTASAGDERSRRSSIVGSTINAVDAKAVQSQLDGLAAASQALVGALDELSKIHPFVTIVVTAFKVAWKFEVTRRQNDKRVQMVNLKMNEMLRTILLLENIARDDRGQDGTSIAQRLSGRMRTVANDIESCAAVCDTFSKKRTVVKLFKSLEWEQKLTGFIDQFDEHKKALHFDLSMHASIGIEHANMTLLTVSGHVENTDSNVTALLLLQLLRSPKDRQLLTKIELKGGAKEALKEESFMKELIGQSEDKEIQGDADTQSKDKPGEIMKSVMRDVGRTIEDMVKENEELFTRKFKAQGLALKEEMEKITRREGDRVIEAITSGPYDRILDPDLYEVWKESGWKGTAKARNLVMALREHYAEHLKAFSSSENRALEKIRGILTSSDQPTTAKLQDIEQVTVNTDNAGAQNQWALQYISISRIQPLLEAFDDDASSLVSISEVNEFTIARPKDWSLPHWMAYWTAGFPLVLKYYFARIQLLMARISILFREVHPTNRPLADYLARDWASTCYIDYLLAGVHEASQDVYDDDELFGKFKGYVLGEEARMKDRLETVLYNIDAINTLDIVTGSGRLEKHILPLISLLLLRVMHVLQRGCEVPLHPKELVNIVDSFWTIDGAIRTRVKDIKAMCKLQNLSPQEQFRKFSYGIYYYVEFSNDVAEAEYWKKIYLAPSAESYNIYGVDYLYRHFMVGVVTYEEVKLCQEGVVDKLLYEPPDDSLHLEVYDDGYDSQSPIALGSTDGRPSTWTGFYVLKQYDESFAGQYPAGIFQFLLPTAEESREVTGSGTDAIGDFMIQGTIDGDQVRYNKHYTFQGGHTVRYQGTLTAERDTLEGTWGLEISGKDIEDLTAPLGESDVAGSFKHWVAPTRFSFIELHDEELANNKPRALWKYAISTVLHLVKVRAGHFSWEYLGERRRMRKRFIELYSRLDTFTASWSFMTSIVPLTPEESEELASLVGLLSKRDLLFYKNLCAVLRRRQVVHWGVSCDGRPSCPTGGRDFLTTRYICLDCIKLDPEKGLESDTIDLCSACMGISKEHGGGMHVPNHALLQQRETSHRKFIYGHIKAGQDALQQVRDEDETGKPRSCDACKETVQPPYWICLGCSESLEPPDTEMKLAALCAACKEKFDKAYSPVCELSFTRSNNSSGAQQPTSPLDRAGCVSHAARESPGIDNPDAAAAENKWKVPEGTDEVSDAKNADEVSEGAQEATDPEGKSRTADIGQPSAVATSEEESPPKYSPHNILDGHEYSHPMIFYQVAPKVEAAVIPADGVEEKLGVMHDHILALGDRMDRLEQLLRRALGIPDVKAGDSVPQIGDAKD